jgi:hypothetical protein
MPLDRPLARPITVTLRRTFATMQTRAPHGPSDPSEPRATLAEFATVLVE